jgi:hypothetical protein
MKALPALVDAGARVIVTTHDSQMRTLLSNLHQIDGFTMTLDEPEKGTVVINRIDTAEALRDETKGFIKETPSLPDIGAQKLAAQWVHGDKKGPRLGPFLHSIRPLRAIPPASRGGDSGSEGVRYGLYRGDS